MNQLKINYHYLNACDMQCKFCFGKINTNYNKEEIINTFHSLTRITSSINFAGGEVFLDIDLLKELVQIGLEKKISMSIVTNGLVLTENLSDERIRYILMHIKKIGISIDSFDKHYNLEVGRHSNGLTLCQSKVEELREICFDYRTKFKINTVVTNKNKGEDLGSKIRKINPDRWKLLQVVSSDPDMAISKDDFNTFTNKNCIGIQCSNENTNSLQHSYVMVNSHGSVYFGEKTPTSININSFMEENSNTPEMEFYQKLIDSGFNTSEYLIRYGIGDANILFDKKVYYKSIGKLIHQEGNKLILDVESISTRPSDLRKYNIETNKQIHLLYCGIITDSKFNIIQRIKGYLNYGEDLNKQLVKSSIGYKRFYRGFLSQIDKYNIQSIFVSGEKTESSFLIDALFHIDDLSRMEYELLHDLLLNIYDVQSIARQLVIKTTNNQIASRNILKYLHDSRPDLFVYTRKVEKNGKSSYEISKLLLKIYCSDITNSEFSNVAIQQIAKYCFDDVYDDYELLYAYEMLAAKTLGGLL
jgi:radical S-adenosyl methionine domain-containing protein 2